MEDFNLAKRWTVSELARIGYFVTPKTLLCTGLGWSVSGFDLVNNFGTVTNNCAAGVGFAATGTCTCTLSGFTWSAGVEQDFGGWRGFLQFKGINYSAKNIILLGANNGPFSTTFTQFGVGGTSTGTRGATEVRRVSADTLELNAGITIPFGVAFNHWRP